MNALTKSFEKLLNIHTEGRDDKNSDEYRFPYEPTPYEVLERLVEEGFIESRKTVLDYGCGKGRVGFFLNYKTGCRYIGLDLYPGMINACEENKVDVIASVNADKVEFILAKAEDFQVPEDVDIIYFFNPFSVEILKAVISKILDSYYGNPREISLIFYYPSDEYMGALMTVDELMFFDEIDCCDLFPGKDERERVVVFKIDAYVGCISCT